MAATPINPANPLFQLPFFINAGLSLLLIFFAPTLEQYPWALTILLLSLMPGSLYIILDRRAVCFGSSLLNQLFLLWLAILAAFIFAPYYFSDDALRHIHDGYWLLQGVDVYSTPANSLAPLAPIGEKLPNHPYRGSIYFPLTQMMAVAGALLSPRYGFLILYSLLVALLGALAWHLSTPRDRRRLIAIFYSPWFLIFAASHHADLQGFMMLLLLARLSIWNSSARLSKRRLSIRRRSGRPEEKLKDRHRARRDERRDERRDKSRDKSRFWQAIIIASAAMLSASMIGLKPEGSLWFLALTLLFVATWRSRGAILLWAGAAFIAIALQTLFSWKYLYHSPQSITAFLDTVHFYMNWLAAYNPWPIFHIENYEIMGVSRKDALLFYRREILAAAILLFLLLPAVWLRRARFSAGSGHSGPSHSGVSASSVGAEESSDCPTLRLLLWPALSLSILLLIASRSVWHPWYFLWLLAALNIGNRWNSINLNRDRSYFPIRFGQFLSWILPLFYLPLIWLHAEGQWYWQGFYLALGLAFCIWMLFLWRVKTRNMFYGRPLQR